jgi:HK97 family phage major capsid protein
MAVYNQGVVRTQGGPDPLVPQPLASDIIQEAPRASAALSLMASTPLSSKTQRMPVLDVLPVAYWVGGDTGMKQTTQQQWKNVVLVVEELACIVPIPEAYLDDADVPLWDQVKPRITEAVGALIDSAVLWGINKPTTWGESVFVGATKSGHSVIEGTGVDLGQDVAALGQAMALTGYTVNGFAAMPGMNWKLTGIRSAQGLPIYQSDMQSGPGGRLYGYQMSEVNNGSWVMPTPGAIMLAGDFTKSMIGIRSDISFKMFSEGVISDDTGKVILNLMQQDSVAMRMTMRLAYATVNPVTIMQPGAAITARWPFGAVLGVGTTPPTTGAIDVKQGYPATGPQDVLLEGGEGQEQLMSRSQWEKIALEEREAAEEERVAVAAGPDDDESGESGSASSRRSRK